MSLKKIEQIKKIYEKITELDDQIIAIEKAAQRIAENDDEIRISITGNYQKETEPVDVNSIGDIRPIYTPFGNFFGGWRELPNHDKQKSFDISLPLCPTEALVVMEAMIRIKNEHRKSLSKQLQQLVPA